MGCVAAQTVLEDGEEAGTTTYQISSRAAKLSQNNGYISPNAHVDVLFDLLAPQNCTIVLRNKIRTCLCKTPSWRNLVRRPLHGMAAQVFLFLCCYESFDLSKTHSLSAQNLVTIFIHSLIYHDDHGKVHQIKEYASHCGNKIAMTMYNIPKIL